MYPRVFRDASRMALALLLAFVLSHACLADPIEAERARAAVAGWLASNPSPFGASVGREIADVRPYFDEFGAAYYIVSLEPEGFVIVSADDLIEPIIGFVPVGRYDASPENPLACLVASDLHGRLQEVRDLFAQAQSLGGPSGAQERFLEARQKWNRLIAQGSANRSAPAGLGSVSDVCVPPLVQSTWGQMRVCGDACYNYYTPPYASGDRNNYYCGCAATAMAQLMRYHMYPDRPASLPCFDIYTCGQFYRCALLRGGNGSGGNYNWSIMDLNPDCYSWPDHIRAIGAICYDAAVSVNTDFCYRGSGAQSRLMAAALRNVFKYCNAISGTRCFGQYCYNIGAPLNSMIGPNLDAGLPVLLAITGLPGGHGVVCDGYGKDSGTLYFHLNMGWDGLDDAWYNLPTVDTSKGTFSAVITCVYNIYPHSVDEVPAWTGEIVSGRITDPRVGGPVSEVLVTLTPTVGTPRSTYTNERGVFSFVNVRPDTTYTIAVSKPEYSFDPQSRVVQTGRSVDDSFTCGNVWGADFLGWTCEIPNPPTNPAISQVTTSSLAFSWTDNSDFEQGFKVYGQPGAGPPSQLQAVTGPNVQSWTWDNLPANSQFALQVLAFERKCESARTQNLTRFTLPKPPVYGEYGDGAISCNRGSGSSSVWYAGGVSVVFTAVNGLGPGPASACKYRYVWNSSPAEPDWNQPSEWLNGSLTFTENSTGTRYLHIRACNGDGAANPTSLTLGPYMVDSVGPTISCPPNLTLNTDPGKCYAGSVALGSPTASDGESGLAAAPSHNAPAQFPTGTTIVTWTVADKAGNSTSCAQRVTVLDRELPSIAAPAALTIAADAGQCFAANVNTGAPVCSDNCGVQSVSSNAPQQFPVGVTTIIWTATDLSGNTSTASQTVKVEDRQSPAIQSPADRTVTTDLDKCFASSVALGSPIVSDNCALLPVTNDAPASYPVGVTVVTWRVSDVNGNSSAATQRITVQDRQNPRITAPPNKTVAANAGMCFASGFDLGSPAYSDNCGTPTLTNNAPMRFRLGTTTVIWKVTDSSGNTATAAQTIKVEDREKPVITAPSARTVTTDARACYATGVALGSPITSDNCLVASVSNNAPSQFPKGTTTVIWTVTDFSANTATASQTVTVQDRESPGITAPAAITVGTNTDQCYATGVSLGSPTVWDNCGTPTVANNAPTQYAKGETVVTWTATDSSGNKSTAAQIVTVEDRQNPRITAPPNINVSADAGSCFATVSNLGTAAASDNCGLASVTNNAPGDRRFAAGVNVVTWTATDTSGRTATASQTVTVTDSQNPTITAPAAITTGCDVGRCYATIPDIGAAIAADNCAVAGVTNNAPANRQFAKGTTTVIWTATDVSGRTATASQTVTVIDGEAPAIEITTPTTEPTYDLLGSKLTIGGVASDNCGVVSVGWVNNRGGSGTATGTTSWSASVSMSVGENIVTFTARDAAGNTAADSIVVNCTDPTIPVVNITSPVSEPAYATTEARLSIAGTASDDVAVSSVSWVNDRGGSGTCTGTTSWSASGIALQPGLNIITVTARDPSGKTGTDTLAVTFTDIKPPVPVITKPTTMPTYVTTVTSVTMSGTVSDDVCVAGMSWLNAATGQTGAISCSGCCTSWTAASVPLVAGENAIYIRGTDSSGNVGSTLMTVKCDLAAPTVTITVPTDAPTWTSGSTPIAIGGTASDDTTLASVKWTNTTTGASGDCVGTTSWSAAGITLKLGQNKITVTAKDIVGRSATDMITVTYSP